MSEHCVSIALAQPPNLKGNITMLRGEQIFQSTALYGEHVFFSLHAIHHSGQINYRGRLLKAENGKVYLQGLYPITVDHSQHDAIMSLDS